MSDEPGAVNGALIVAWILIGGGIGAAIGSSKGKGGAGFVLGALLGPIGWIIAAVMPRTPELEARYQAQVAAAGGHPVADSAAATSSGAHAGWAPDPYERHTHRYFDGARWTANVADGQVIGTDNSGFSVPATGTSGWAPDPWGRFPQRFYDASGWTSHVARGGQTFSDPADFAPPPPPSAVPPPPPT